MSRSTARRSLVPRVVAAGLLCGLLAAGCAESPAPGACDGIGCSGHGYCVASAGFAYCVCAAGFHPVGVECLPNDPGDPCRGVTCDAHGTCVALDGVPACDCDPGYEESASLHCTPLGGADADADADGETVGPDGGCTAGLTECGGRCVDLFIDAENCGTCGHVCPDGLHAVAACVVANCFLACEPGWSDLDGAPGCEAPCSSGSPTESCNGLDDNCNGATDETFPCAAGTFTVCSTTCDSVGTGVCSADCTLPDAAACNPPAEVCNGADDDCDGTPDNGFACSPGASGACTTSCGSTGTHDCTVDCAWSACAPPAEVCNGADDDCDGSTDEGFTVWSCPLTGARTADAATCNTGCSQSAACGPAPLSVSGTITLRSCDWEGSCSPNDYVDRVVAAGSTITIQRSTGWSGWSDIGSLTLAGATASGTITLRNCDWEGSCSPNDYVDRVVAAGSTITIQKSTGWSGWSDLGSLTLAPTGLVCPLDGALPCPGGSCSRSASCVEVAGCP
ncbi:MAG: hypothetical protein JXB32_06550 [Deltaproteobacteria bacterium]|nr:hypothetical protein [Deltaproteobacteria bacterium]